jgi:uncharacterized membrane protein YeaQ/YmgE (transglycosylase-associated protein family)
VSLVARIVLGLMTGFLASQIVNKTGEGEFLNMVLGIVGAAIGCAVTGGFPLALSMPYGPVIYRPKRRRHRVYGHRCGT